ncbi:hypothetical protein ACIRU3_25900 [Streptomyces sp. NPDC101151]|uniref:hypothetical protein n=1 Tax=Streptomyces sp. NPDC101151 TaxID=3366115 RepID=UPI00382E8BF7
MDHHERELGPRPGADRSCSASRCASQTATQPGDAQWEEIVELPLHSVSGQLMVRGLMDDLDEELPVLSFDGPGDYRLRVHARGRDTAIDLAPDEITEWYLIQAWPEPAQDAAVLRRTATYGASVRAG